MMRSSKFFRRGKGECDKSELNITHFSSQFVLRIVLHYSITEDDPPAMKHGCLVWWTLHTNQPLDISPLRCCHTAAHYSGP